MESSIVKSEQMTFIHVYADESRQNAHRYMLFGALFVPRGEAENALLADCAALRTRFDWKKGEFKWGKVSRSKLRVYQEFSDILFRHPDAAFRCLVVDTHQVDLKAYHDNNSETAFYNFYCLMLSRNMQAENQYLIFTDERSNRERNRLSDLKANINSYWRSKGALGNVAANVEPRISKENDLLQIVDVLLGAVGYAIEEFTTSEPRLSLTRHIAARLGVEELRTHRGRDTNFTIWMLDFERAGKKK